MGKLVSLSEIKTLSRKHKEAPKTIVFTNGCFDILHAGQLSLQPGISTTKIIERIGELYHVRR